tara:strand:+ start:345 stop:584 length:240 start_codon:yes stop_codon:yes gene_type:complete
MTPFLEKLIAGGPGYRASVSNTHIGVTPDGADEAALIAFQPIAHQIIENAGDGYSLHPEPKRNSDYSTDYYDAIMIVLD